MAEQTSEVTFGTYYVREGVDAEFESTISESWAALRRLGFIEPEEPQLFRSVSGARRYVELTRWRPGVMGPAHEHPDLIPIWVRMAGLVEPHVPDPVERGLDFDEFVPVVPHAAA